MTDSPTRIKICGLRDVPTIESMDGLPFHEMGFVFAPSKRQVSIDEAPALLAAAGRIGAAGGKPPATVGVFVDMPLAVLDELLSAAPLQVVQLHGSESPDYCRELKNKHPDIGIWRVFSVGKSDGQVREQHASLREYAVSQLKEYRGLLNAVLIDAPGGGTGQPFDWQAIDAYKQAAARFDLPLYVAGGLSEENVGELVRGYSPGGVDVSSGVESDGRKDITKIRAFVRKVIES
ncbi:phosphoribosylanthranilate isomerase [Paenibacillus agaridevorans]|uniref:phosphoribosylanthranilate isomerase n=1 Tax=Paenibacillus agaridevorans TaxID=171404 RepID=UPI001BE45B1D|nr:phosphoribosylanthranilate isomerase [Paenibacillus agaridevorans]